jgi:hypothetical protein
MANLYDSMVNICGFIVGLFDSLVSSFHDGEPAYVTLE